MTTEAYSYDEHDVEIDPDLLHSHLGGSEINEILYRMTHSGEFDPNISFGEYMRTFEQCNAEPEVFVLTVSSAIPVADAIRGWYDTMGKQYPEITYVNANRDLSEDELSLTLEQRELIESDITRLGQRYLGARAIIIDQYVHSGKTLDLASRTLGKAGLIQTGSTSQARWYNHAFGQIDRDSMTSEHAEFMRRVGREAVYCTDEEYLAEQRGY